MTHKQHPISHILNMEHWSTCFGLMCLVKIWFYWLTKSKIYILGLNKNDFDRLTWPCCVDVTCVGCDQCCDPIQWPAAMRPGHTDTSDIDIVMRDANWILGNEKGDPKYIIVEQDNIRQ